MVEDGFKRKMKNMEGERAYLDLVRRILESEREPSPDRTGVGTLSLFGTSLRFDLRRGFPLLTTKKMFWKGVVEELLWFVAGKTDARQLAARGVHIWDRNGALSEGDLGPIYGFQWRHFGAHYRGAQADYSGEGVDQLSECIRLIRTEPSSRRILMSAWNPCDLGKMVLPPCHVLCQFHVAVGANGPELSCQLYQRSADMGLGVPFNIASYALLTHMVAHVCGIRVGEFIHAMGDCHVYATHREALGVQLNRVPFELPQLRISSEIRNIDDFRPEHFELLNYEHHEPLAMAMAL